MDLVKIRIASKGSDTMATDQNPIRTAIRTSRWSQGLERKLCRPWTWAITGDTAMGMPLPSSQTRK